MGDSVEIICVYSNGEILSTDEGPTFRCDDPIAMRVKKNITLNRLRLAIGRKLRLANNQIVSQLIYRQPIRTSPIFYRLIRLHDNDDVGTMWLTNARFPTYLGAVELYAEIDAAPIDLNEQAGTNEHEEFDPTQCLTPQFTAQYSSPSIDPTSQPSSSSCPIGDIEGDEGHDHYIDDDILDDISDEGQYDAQLHNDNDEGEDIDEEEDVEEAIVGDLTGPVATYDDPAAAFFAQINLEVASGPEFPEMEAAMQLAGGEFYEGMTFESKGALKLAAKIYSVRVHHTYKVCRSASKYEEYRCSQYGEGCNWRLRACLKDKQGIWQITKYSGPHACLSAQLSQDHPKLDSDVIASYIVEMVTDTPQVHISQIQRKINDTFGYTVSYKKAWAAKHKAISIAFGNWERSYSLMPRWLAAVQASNPGSYHEFINRPLPHAMPDGGPMAMFHRVFWTFKPCIEAFPHLKPIIQIDGTFLYGKYKGTLLIASSQDGNTNVVPLAFALVEGETTEAWSWFLYLLRQRVVKERQGICLISDRAASILSAIANPSLGWQPPFAHNVFCLRHVLSNLNTRFHLAWLKDMIKRLGLYIDFPVFSCL